MIRLRRLLGAAGLVAALSMAMGCGSGSEPKPAEPPPAAEAPREKKKTPYGEALQQARDVRDAAAEHDKQLQELIDQQPHR